MPELPELNPVIHGKLRLALLSLLVGVEEAEFTWLRARTGSTDGNLGAQLQKLGEAGHVTGEKRRGARPPPGRNRFPPAAARGVDRIRPGVEATARRSDLVLQLYLLPDGEKGQRPGPEGTRN